MGDYLEFHPISEPYPMIGGIPWTRLPDGKPVAVNGDGNPEWREFVMSIRTKGLLQPIIVWDKKIIDGRNRYIACLEANVKPVFRDVSDVARRWDKLDADEKLETATDVVLHANTRREHYSPIKRALVVVPHYLKWIEESGSGVGGDRQSISPVTGPMLCEEALEREDDADELLPWERACEYGGKGVTRKALKKASSLHKYYGGNVLQAIVQHGLSVEQLQNLVNKLDEHINGDTPTGKDGQLGVQIATLIVGTKEQTARLALVAEVLKGAGSGDAEYVKIAQNDWGTRAVSLAGNAAHKLRTLAEHGITLDEARTDKLRGIVTEITELLEKVTE